jgi:arylsulfatase A-like enzyme
MVKKPNILFITADQQRGDCYGFRGRKVKTPHLDRLAAAGTHFENCLNANTVCQPARSSILTGMLPLTHGVIDNGIDLDPKIGEQGFAGQMSKAGYHTAFIGKAHFSTKATFAPTGTPECQTSSADFDESWLGPYMGFEHAELIVLGHWHKNRPSSKPPAGGHFERWFYENAGEEGYELWADETRPGTGAAQTWNSALPVAWHNSTWLGDRTIDYLRNRQKDNKQDQPFCAWVSFPDPHHPFDCPEPWSRLHNPKDVDLPKHGEKDLDGRPWWHRASLESEPELADPIMKKFRAQGSRAPDQTEEQLREMTANYYGMISLIDHNVGRILSALDDAGLSEDTYVFYTADHGDLLGDHGLYLKGPTPYESLLNVGLIARGPQVKAGHAEKSLISTLDLAATFCDIGETKLPGGAQSQSFQSLLKGESGSGDPRYNEWNVNPSRCGVPLELRTVRTDTHKLTMELVSGAGEMYDLEHDPNEMKNIFEKASHASVRRELEKLIDARPGPVRKSFDEPVGMA